MTTYGTIPTSSGVKMSLESVVASEIRPWKEFFDYGNIGIPSFSFSSLMERLKTNLSYFSMNYSVACLIIVFVSLLWHPISLIVFLVMLSAWLFLYFLRDQPFILLNRTIDHRIVLLFLSVLTLFFLFLTRATWNIISSLLLSAFLVLLHALFMNAPHHLHQPSYTAIPSSSS